MSSFQLQQLPSLPIKEVFKSLGVCDLLNLCRSSNKSRRLVKKSLKDITFTLKIVAEEKHYKIWLKEDFSKHKARIRAENSNGTSLFKNIRWLMHTFWVETVYLDCTNVEEGDVVKVVEYLKKEKPYYLKLYFECPMISDSLWQLMLNCEADVLIISVDREVKVTFDNVPLLFNCECIILHGVKFSEKGMNLLFKTWQSSKERTLQCVSLTRKLGPFWKKQANEKVVLKGIDVESVEKKRIFKVKKDGIKKSTTYNLVKNDGELATLKFDKQEICFHTENDR